MKGLRFIIAIVAAGLLLMPITVKAASYEGTQAPPPVAQALVREGDFAVQLAGALNLGTFDDEAKAEDVLASVGIAPRNGWIADYPLTPDIVAELKDSIDRAVDSNQLLMSRVSAQTNFDDLAARMGLPVAAGSQGEYAQGSSGSSDYVEPTIVDNYYYDDGPPVVTYYAPPWDYAYLYTWVPWPFWYTDYFFPGFFILNDFDRVIIVDRDHDHHHDRDRDFHSREVHRVSNHVVDPSTHRTALVDPVTRNTGRGLRSIASVHQASGSNSTFRNSAQSILRHNSTSALNHAALSGNAGALGQRGSISSNRLSPAVHEPSAGTRLSSPGLGERSFQSHASMNFGRPFSEARSFSAPRSFSGGSSFRSFGGSGFAHAGFAHGGFGGGGFAHGGGRRR